jgi:hypothetical protein
MFFISCKCEFSCSFVFYMSGSSLTFSLERSSGRRPPRGDHSSTLEIKCAWGFKGGPRTLDFSLEESFELSCSSVMSLLRGLRPDLAVLGRTFSMLTCYEWMVSAARRAEFFVPPLEFLNEPAWDWSSHIFKFNLGSTAPYYLYA